MLENGVVSVRQFQILVFIFTIGSSVLYIPSLLAGEAKQDAWIASAFGVMIGIFVVIIINTLAKLYPNMNFAQYTELILGKWIGKVVNLAFFFNFYMLSAFVLRDVGDFITTLIMPETPIESILIIFILVVIMGIRLGLESLARTAEIFYPWIVILTITLILALTPQFTFSNLQPIFEMGTKTIIRASLPFIANPFFQISIFLMIYPYVQQKIQAGKGFYLGVVKGSVLLILLTMITIMVLGVDTTSRHYYPTYSLAKKINIGNFLQRIEALLAGIWFISIFFKLAICFYGSTLSLAHILGLKDYRFLVVPLGVILVVLSIIVYPTIAFTGEFVKWMFTYFGTMGFVIPIILLFVSKIRNISARSNPTK